MKQQFILFKRGGIFYCEDTSTGKQESLRTKDAAEAKTLLHARNEAVRQPFLNLRIAQTYLAASDPQMLQRTWQQVMDEYVRSKNDQTRARAQRAAKEPAFDLIRALPLTSTQAEHFLRVLEQGGVSTNVHLRRFHNFALDMNWLPWPVLPKRQWPAIRFKEKRAISLDEHQRIIERESNPERKAFYEMCWHLGGSQSDVANLKAQDIDWQNQTISFFRHKTGRVQMVHFGEQVAALLRRLPHEGLFFPRLTLLDEKHRACLFQMACRRVGIKGVSLHSYRYAWAERAKAAGMPERFAMENLGHNSSAVHRAYAKKAQVKIPSLEEYEKRIIPMPKAEAV